VEVRTQMKANTKTELVMKIDKEEEEEDDVKDEAISIEKSVLAVDKSTTELLQGLFNGHSDSESKNAVDTTAQDRDEFEKDILEKECSGGIDCNNNQNDKEDKEVEMEVKVEMQLEAKTKTELVLKFDKEEEDVEDNFEEEDVEDNFEEALSQQVRPILSISILIVLQIHVVEVVVVVVLIVLMVLIVLRSTTMKIRINTKSIKSTSDRMSML